MAVSGKAPLQGVKVVDLGGVIAGPLAAMLLADQGAETIGVRKPGRERAGLDAVLDRNKTVLTCDLKTEGGRNQVQALLEDADILIENFGLGVAARLGFDPVALRKIHPHLIIVSLPGFLAGDGMADIKAYEGVIAAATGQYTDIHAVRELFGLDPVYTALPLASIYAGVHAATAAVLALRGQKRTGAGVHIQSPVAGAALSAMSSIYLDIEQEPDRYATPRLPGVVKNIALPLIRHLARSGSNRRQGRFLDIARKSYPAMMTSYACACGSLLYLFAIDNAKLSRALLFELGLLSRAEEAGLVFADPYRWDRRDNLADTSNLSRKWQARLKAWIAEEIAKLSAEEWSRRFSAAKVPYAIQWETKEWLARAELEAAGIISRVSDPEFGSMRQPGLQAWVSTAPKALASPSPNKLGFSTGIPAWSSKSESRKPDMIARSVDPVDARLPLKGIKVIDMCSMVAGPVAGRTLAEYGARVIKVEAPTPNHGPRMTCWYGIDVNQGKESVVIDARLDQGRKAIESLIANADILLTNHTPPAMTAMGLDETQVRALSPSILYCVIGAYNGPNAGAIADQVGYDPILQAAAGIMRRYGEPGHPELHAIASCVDALTGYSAAFGAALGLFARDKDRAGRRIDASLAIAATLVQLPFAFDHEGRRWEEPRGQQAKGENAFYRLYQCKDGWIFLASPGACVSDLPKEWLPTETDEPAIAASIGKVLAKRTVSSALDACARAGFNAVRVDNVKSLSGQFLAAPANAARRLVARDIPGLGRVVSVPPIQTHWNGDPLEMLPPAEKPGASTRAVLVEHALSADALIAQGVAAEEISDDRLPT